MSNWNPTIEVESVHGTREISLTTRHLMNRRVFLTGEITAEAANDFLSQMLYLEEDASKPVTVILNSVGGEVNAGLMIYDCLQNTALDVDIVCTGIAASMAAVILAGGKKGRRKIMKHSKVMIHEPLITGGLGGSATSIKNISDSILETRNTINDILAFHTGKSRIEIDKATNYDNYMDAEEAVDFGICDEIIVSSSQM